MNVSGTVFLTLCSFVPDFARSAAGRPASYAAVLRMKMESSSSSLLNPRTRQRQGRGSVVQDWPLFSRHRPSDLRFEEDDHIEGQNLNITYCHLMLHHHQ